MISWEDFKELNIQTGSIVEINAFAKAVQITKHYAAINFLPNK